MARRTLILGAIAAAIVVSACRGTQNRAEAPGRPNILVILLDDLRWNATGYAGHPHVRTPQIDRIANEGVNFRNAFNYEKQFPYTPNVRGVRTADWNTSTIPTVTADPTGISPSSTIYARMRAS
jgi:hypothetical protein